jgi:hypothetical protein
MPNPLNKSGVMPNEADTCRKFVVQKFLAAGWDSDPHSTAEKVRTLCANPGELRARWADSSQRADQVKSGKFGGADRLRNAVKQLQSLLYAA